MYGLVAVRRYYSAIRGAAAAAARHPYSSSSARQQQQRQRRRRGLLLTAVTTTTSSACWAMRFNGNASSLRYASLESNKKNDDDDNNENNNVNEKSCSSNKFDLIKEWEQATTQGRDMLAKWIETATSDDVSSNAEKEENKNKNDTATNNRRPNVKLSDMLDGLFSTKDDTLDDAQDSSADIATKETDTSQQQQQVSWTSILGNITKLIVTGGRGDDAEDANINTEALQDLIEEARKSSGKGDVRDSTSFTEMLSIMEQHYHHLDQTLENTFGHLDLSRLFPSSFFYYLEREDEVKNPSWKRRVHRFHPGVNIEQVQDLMSALYLAELSYKDSVEDIQEGLLKTKHAVELIYCDTESEPNQPAHYIILHKEQPQATCGSSSSSLWTTNSNSLHVTMVVRGTRSVSDALTDAFMEAEDYRGGKAHKGILESGRHLVGLHTELLQKLCKLANKRNVHLTLVGHSLGGAAAAIAGIEFNDNPMITANVIGFGCPSLLSEQLAMDTKDFITTVIADADMIPRMNGITIANKLLDIMEYDWIPMARRDVWQVLQELRRVAPSLLDESNVKFLMTTVDSWLETYVQPTILPTTTMATANTTKQRARADCLLYPPGRCIHFFRDGSGITGSQPPCTFFNDIDVARTMVDDHLIDRGYRRIFLEVMRQYKRNHHFSFEEDKYWK